MNNITFVIFTYNEEKRIGYIVRNFVKYGEVLILDGGSTDRTKEIVEKLGGKFVLRPKIDSVIAEDKRMYDFIKKLVKVDWIFWGFADNLMPKSLLEKLVEISHQAKIKYVNIPLYTYLWGYIKEPIQKGYSPRFFMKNYVDFSNNKIHGMGKFLGNKNEILTLPNRKEYAIRHYSTFDLRKFVLTHLKYAEEEAEQRHNEGQRFNLFRTIGSMIRYFILYTKNGFKAGIVGILVGISYAFFRFMMFFRVYELENNITLELMEEKYSKAKEKLLKDIK